MARNNLAKCLPITLAYEGGMSMIKSDPGNWTGGKVGVGVLKGTKYGIAASAFPDLDIKNLTLSDVQPIYKTKYWDKVRGDDLPFGVDLAVFDYGVNSGPSRSAKELQRVLKMNAVDGVIGQATLNVLGSVHDAKFIIQGVCARRLSFLKGLTIFKTFGKGWSKRVADVEARGVAMWLAASGASAAASAGVLKGEAAKANATAKSQNTGAVGTAGTGAGVSGTNAATASDPNWLLIAGIAAAVIVVAVILVLKARQNKERATAYETAAAAV